MSGEGKVVCVTGASGHSGYVASWLVKLLLERRYTIKTTVRNLSDPRKVVHLKSLEGAKERLRLFEADLIEDGSFDSVVDGCDGVFHTASPVFYETTNAQRVRGWSKSTVVVTSSISTVMSNRNPKGSDVVVDETWFSDPAFCEENKHWYALSKTLAEAAAWKFAEENGIDLVVMHPGFVLGRLLQPTLNLSSKLLLDITKGKKVFPCYYFVDVRDVVRAHIMAFENPSASGRYLLVGESISRSETLQLLHKLYPSISCPINAIARENSISRVSKKKAESLGINFIPLEVSLKDTVESLKERNFMSL